MIPLANKLQDVFGAIGQQQIDLPQITVVGSQSAGKSSVLEHVVGRDFLPRGNGICTRRPLVLQLYNTGSPSDSNAKGDDSSAMEEWGEFLHLPNQRFYDFNEIRLEIVRDTDRITGKNKNVSNKSIHLKIFSPHVLNLTLVDLPGITKVPTGDQSEDIEEQIRAMCLEYIANPNAIILAVTAANQDIANSDGLKLARSVDPDGVRTIGVLTKVDIMDQGTDCLDVLNNQAVPLRRGYIAVVNRSQKDIQDNVSIRQALKKETAFFQTHPKYRTVLTKCGTVNLTRSLNHVLIHHIKDCLPDIRKKVLSMLTDVQANLLALGESCESSENAGENGRLLLRLISTFAQNFRNIVDGHELIHNGAGSGAVSAYGGAMLSDSTELYGGARIAYIFNESFVNRAVKQMNPFEGLEDVDIRTAIANANGARGPSLFIPESAFELLVRKQIERLREPGLQCIDYVFEELQRMAYHADSPEISRFPHLRDKIYEVVNRLLRDCVTPTQQMVNNLINVELCYINTSHPDFIGGKSAVAQMNKKMNRDSHGHNHGHNHHSHHGNSNGNASQPSQPPNPPNPPTASNPAAPVPATTVNNSAGSASIPSHATAPSSSAQGSSNNANGNQQALGIPGGGFFELFKYAPTAVNANSTSAAPTAVKSSGPPASSASSGTGVGSASAGGVVKLPPVPDRMRSSQTPSDREKLETELIKSLVGSYFDIVRKNYSDMVPKSIMHFLVHCFKEKLQNELVSSLYKDNHSIADLLRESEDIAQRRKSYVEMRELLNSAVEILNEVRDYNIYK